jgi:hypothetical protein
MANARHSFFVNFGVGFPSGLNQTANYGAVTIGEMTGASFDTFSVEVSGCVYSNVGLDLASAESDRELCFGDEYFGTFSRAYFTLIQVRVGDLLT